MDLIEYLERIETTSLDGNYAAGKITLDSLTQLLSHPDKPYVAVATELFNAGGSTYLPEYRRIEQDEVKTLSDVCDSVRNLRSRSVEKYQQTFPEQIETEDPVTKEKTTVKGTRDVADGMATKTIDVVVYTGDETVVRANIKQTAEDLYKSREIEAEVKQEDAMTLLSKSCLGTYNIFKDLIEQSGENIDQGLSKELMAHIVKTFGPAVRDSYTLIDHLYVELTNSNGDLVEKLQKNDIQPDRSQAWRGVVNISYVIQTMKEMNELQKSHPMVGDYSNVPIFTDEQIKNAAKAAYMSHIALWGQEDKKEFEGFEERGAEIMRALHQEHPGLPDVSEFIRLQTEALSWVGFVYDKARSDGTVTQFHYDEPFNIELRGDMLADEGISISVDTAYHMLPFALAVKFAGMAKEAKAGGRFSGTEVLNTLAGKFDHNYEHDFEQPMESQTAYSRSVAAISRVAKAIPRSTLVEINAEEMTSTASKSVGLHRTMGVGLNYPAGSKKPVIYRDRIFREGTELYEELDVNPTKNEIAKRFIITWHEDQPYQSIIDLGLHPNDTTFAPGRLKIFGLLPFSAYESNHYAQYEQIANQMIPALRKAQQTK